MSHQCNVIKAEIIKTLQQFGPLPHQEIWEYIHPLLPHKWGYSYRSFVRAMQSIKEVKCYRQNRKYICELEEPTKMRLTTLRDVAAISQELSNQTAVAHHQFPYAETRTYWICSDGNEFSKEIDALRHELMVERGKRR